MAGLIKPSPQPVPPAEFRQLPLQERIRIAAVNWVEDGFGTPRMLHIVYILKMLGLYFAVGLWITSMTTSGVGFTDPSTWFDNIVVYQKLAIWLMLLEVIGLAGTFGPLCGHFVPMLGGIRYWVRPGTIRMAPYARTLPGTGGDERTWFDVLLYVAVLASLIYPMAIQADPVTVPLLGGVGEQELVPAIAFIPVLITVPLMGLRDKVIFLAARAEQYLPVMLFSAIFGGIALSDSASGDDFVNLVVAFKIVICVIWICAGISKLGEHFINVVPPMVSNSPGVPNAMKRATFRNSPDDLRPSRLAWFMAHIGGTTAEIGVPLVLLFATNNTVAMLGALAMLAFHIYITSTFPLAVPLEWNVYFGYVAIVLWGGFGDGFSASTYNIFEFSAPLWLIPMFALLLFGPILGNLKPQYVSFLPSMRQYSGNWASAVWAMKPGVEERLNELPLTEIQVDQLQRMAPTPYEEDDAHMTMDKLLAWRSLHSQGRGVFSALYTHLDDIDTRTVREAEFICNAILGWNFGDGHMHDERLIASIQKRLNLAPGDLVVA
ncbi:MAG: DUF3556 domain-containing protein, partial [Nocardioidaceae bacterium]|nr:DUF3556 domain-containing protein [Nocardioidaceae bacterium]